MGYPLFFILVGSAFISVSILIKRARRNAIIDHLGHDPGEEKMELYEKEDPIYQALAMHDIGWGCLLPTFVLMMFLGVETRLPLESNYLYFMLPHMALFYFLSTLAGMITGKEVDIEKEKDTIRKLDFLELRKHVDYQMRFVYPSIKLIILGFEFYLAIEMWHFHINY